MKTGYLLVCKFLLFIVVCTVTGASTAGFALDSQHARTSARVNLRQTPDLSGQILDTIPNGHQVVILQENGLWWKVEVDGRPSDTGWVYARYLKKIAPKTPQAEPLKTSVRIEMGPRQQLQRIHPIESVRVPVLNASQSDMPTGAAEKEIEPPAQGQEPDPSQQPLAGPSRPSIAAFKPDAPEIDGQNLTEPTGRTDSNPNLKGLREEKRKTRTSIAREVLPEAGDRSMSAKRAPASTVVKLAVSHGVEGYSSAKKSRQPLRVTLKLLSTILFAIIALLLYKGYGAVDPRDV